MISLCVADAATLSIAVEGDALITKLLEPIYKKAPKGIAFPTSISPNRIAAHLAPFSESDPANIVLRQGDLVKVMLGVHIDGYPAVVAESIVVGEPAPATANLVRAAWLASEVALRTFTVKNSNWDVTNVVSKVAEAHGVKAVEDMLSHNMERNVLYGSKEIILNPQQKSRQQMDTFKFEVGQVYGLDVLVTDAPDGKVKPTDFRTSMYKLTGNLYSLRMKMSHRSLAELKSKSSGPFPVNIRQFEDPPRARGGLAEACNHKVVLPYEVMGAKEGNYVAQFFTTFGISKNGIIKYTEPAFDEAKYTSEHTLDGELLELLKTPLLQEKDKK